MEIVRLVLLLLHLLGFAALFGGLLVQAREPVKRVNSLMRDGAGTAVVAGILLVGVIEMGDFATADSFNAKVGVKLIVGIVILALVMANLRKERISQALWATLLALTVTNTAIALFWAPAHGAY
jgi:hypothetical protein